ncbi:MAG: ribonuclease P protein component [Bacteroidaceae bacterium]|nr:ribonuclease P protein component [Bacteroidaceae bacterium]
MNTVHSFPKSERLCSRKAIEALFASGNRSFTAFPLRVVYRQAEETQLLISVSKRHFKHAVDRNRAKRQIREAWRLNRDILTATNTGDAVPSPAADASSPAPTLHLAFIWLADEPQPSELVHRKLKHLLHRIREQLTESRNIEIL